LFMELTFLKFHKQMSLLKSAKHLLDISDVLFLGFRVYENVIKICDIELV
jgi:hypothetical protein